MINIFMPQNAITDIQEEDYSKIPDIIQCVEAFARSTYKLLYIIDYHRKNFLYVSSSFTAFTGMTQNEVMKKGFLL